MRTIAAILCRDVRELAVAYRFAPLALVAVCLLFVLSLPPGLAETQKPFSLAVDTGNNDYLAPFMDSMLENIALVEDVHLCSGESEAKALIEDGTVLMAVILPDDMERALIRGEHIDISIISAREMQGTMLYTLARSAADAVNELQSASNAYYELARQHFHENDELYDSYISFTRELLSDALTRSRLIDYYEPPEPYTVQILAMLIFTIASAAAMCVAAVTAGQRQNGAMRRMRAHGAAAARVIAAKLIVITIATVLLALPFAAIAAAAGMNVPLPELLAAVCVVALSCSPFYLLCAALCKSEAQTLLAGCAVLIVLLFTGGCLYPPYLTGFVIPGPASLSFSIAGWLLC